MNGSAAFAHLRDLEVGDTVPDGLYVLDYRDGTRPTWKVVERMDMSAIARLVLEDEHNGADDLFDSGNRVRLVVLTCERFTRRGQPYPSGSEPRTNPLCDMDQQGRRAS